MFGLASGFYENYLIPPEVSILIIGLDDAGKTTLLERLKVTDFKNEMLEPSGKRISVKSISKASAAGTATASSTATDTFEERQEPQIKQRRHVQRPPEQAPLVLDNPPSVVKPKRRIFACPAPRSYRFNTEDDDDSEFFEEDQNEPLKPAPAPSNGSIRDENENYPAVDTSSVNGGIITLPSSDRSLPIESPETMDKHGNGSHRYLNGMHSSSSTLNTDISTTANENDTDNENEKDKDKQYDVKTDSKIFPLHLIRPTVGMNLAKFEAFGAKVRAMDVGGSSRMRALWERYYKDIHGIAFVVDVSSTAEVSKLMEARAFYRCMRDDESLVGVPVLIFANKTDIGSSCVDDEDGDETNRGKLGDTSLLDVAELFLSSPNGATSSSIDNPSDHRIEDLAMFAGSAKSGAGVRVAFEWLIQKGKTMVKQNRRTSVH